MRSERGVILVLAAVFAVIFLLFAALAIGLGMVSYSKSEAQIIANGAALAAVEAWVSTTGGNKAQAALSRANTILARNKISGLRDQSLGIGQLYHEGGGGPNSAGTLRLGRLYPRNPGGSTPPPSVCNQGGQPVFPCFVYSSTTPDSDDTVNAAQVILRTGSYNPVLGPFIPDWLGQSLFTIEVVTTASFVERCTALLMDVSLNATYDTHNNNSFAWQPVPQISPAPRPVPPAVAIWSPSLPSLYAYRNSSLSFPDGQSPLDCSNWNSVWRTSPPSDAVVNNVERVFRCSTRPSRVSNPSPYPWDGSWPTTGPVPQGPLATTDPEYQYMHYWDDYEFEQHTRWGPVMVDKYVDAAYSGPQPLRTFLDAFNLALRTLKSQQTSMDQATIKVFTGRKLDEIPPYFTFTPPYTGPSLSTDLGYMIQITNYMNIRPFYRNALGGQVYHTSSVVTPNFLTHGWYPLFPDSTSSDSPIIGGTNMVEILDETIADLTAACPVNAKKQIVLATDGISTCSYETHTTSGGQIVRHSDGQGPRVCDGSYATYLLSENQLLAGSGPPFASDIGYPSIIERLRENEIAVTVLLTGSYVEPNMLNIRDFTPPSPNPYGNAPFPMDYLEAMGLGFTGFASGRTVPAGQDGGLVPADFMETESSCPDPDCEDEDAFTYSGRPGYVFRRPNGVLGRLAMMTGGLWCPLAPLDMSPNAYDPINGNIHRHRQIGTVETFAHIKLGETTNEQKTQMAAQCASQAVGFNPYILTEPAIQGSQTSAPPP